MVRKKSHLTSRKNMQTAFNKNRAKINKEKRLAASELAGLGHVSDVSDEEAGASFHSDTSPIFDNSSSDGFLGFDVSPSTEGITVLCLFDGIGTGRLALKKLGIPIKKYISSETDPIACNLLKFHYYDEITAVGCVKTLTCAKLDAFGPIHLLLGGSPCQDLSLCNPKRKGLHGKDSSGQLFFEYHRILMYLKDEAKKKGHKFFWLFENTFSMEVSVRNEISSCLGCSPVVRCASDLVAMIRRRYFWGNIIGSNESETTHCGPHLQDFLVRPYRIAAVKCLPTLTTNPSSQLKGKDKQLPVIEDGVETGILITEMESLFGVPQHYTDVNNLSVSARRSLLGKAWCVPVICKILEPLVAEFN